MSARQVLDSEGARRADLAAIHMGKAELGWSDDEYRDVMWAVCSVRSAAALDFAGRKRFLDHLRKCGFKGKAGGEGRGKTPWGPRQRLMWALWQQLADAQRVNDRSRKGLHNWLHNQLQVDRVEWLNTHQLEQAIEMLKAWLKRPPGANHNPEPAPQRSPL